MNKDIMIRGVPYIDLTAKGCASIEEGMKHKPLPEECATMIDAIIARIKSGLSASEIDITSLRWEK